MPVAVVGEHRLAVVCLYKKRISLRDAGVANRQYDTVLESIRRGFFHEFARGFVLGIGLSDNIVPAAGQHIACAIDHDGVDLAIVIADIARTPCLRVVR